MKNLRPIKNEQTGNTEERILKQAMRLFLEKGYHGTSIDDITHAAGLTKGALYWHFKSKENILKNIVKEFESRFLDGLIHAVRETEGGALNKLEKLIRYNSAFAYYNRELCVSFTTIAAELVGAHHGIESEIRRIYEKYQKFLLGLILHGKREKVFRKDIDSGLAALVIMAFHDGIMLHWSMNRDKIDGQAYVNTFKEILLNGVKH
jgi:AcrR family transcriptional regulator